MFRPRYYAFLMVTLAGCGEPQHSPQAAATFHRDVAPILFEHCASCHHDGGAAPFSLVTYAAAKARASQIAEVTKSRFMPPWLPEAGHAKFENERQLADDEIALIAKWSAGGAPEGDPQVAPPEPQFAGEWQLGEPDLVLQSPDFVLPAAGPDRFRNFVLPVHLDERRWVRAVGLRPANPKVTHHIRLGIDSDGESARRDAADPEPGYEGMAWGADPEGQLITWTPGMQADQGTEGSAWQLSSDTKLVLHTHLQPSGKPENVRFRVGLYFTDKPSSVRPVILRVGSRGIGIPPGEPRFTVRDSYRMPIDVDATYIFPHAHSLCREMKVTLEYCGKELRTLLHIKRFDENWHDAYRFAYQPVRIARGVRIVTRFVYDNSAANARNPYNPPQRVVYGSNASDEMQDVYLQVIPVDPRERSVLVEHHDQYELKSKIAGYEKSLEIHARDPFTRESLAACLIVDKNPQQAIELLRPQSKLLQTSLQAGTILAMAELANGETERAIARFRNVLAADDKLAVAWLGLGQALVKDEKPSDAEQAYRQAIAHNTHFTAARLELIDLLISQQRMEDAIAECRRVSDLQPDSHELHLKLANIFARHRRYAEALQQFARARALAPYVYSPEASLAIACYQNGDEQKAAGLLQKAIEADSHDPVPYCFLGQIARRNGQFELAHDHFLRALDLPLPDTWPGAYARQFLILVYTEQLQLAQETENAALLRDTAEAWLELEPDNVDVQKLLLDLNAR